MTSNRNVLNAFTLSILCTALFSTAAMSEPKQVHVIKTIQQNGKVVYSDQIPDTSEVPAKQFELKSYGLGPSVAPQLSPNAVAAAKKAKETQAEEEAAKARVVELSPEETALKKENCMRLKQNMAALANGRVIRFKEGGERYYLDDSQVASERAKTASELTKTCQ